MKNSSAGTKRILLVEDEPGITQICQRTLTSEGFEVDIAVNGVVAQDMLGEKDYELVIIDIRTPVMNGKQLYQYIEERYPWLIDGVIFTSGDVISNDIQYFLKQNGKPFIPKPFTPDELNTTVRETLRGLD